MRTSTMKSPTTSTTTMKIPKSNTTIIKSPATSSTPIKSPTTSTAIMKSTTNMTYNYDFNQKRASFEKKIASLDEVVQDPKFYASNRWKGTGPSQQRNKSFNNKKKNNPASPISKYFNTEYSNNKSYVQESGAVTKSDDAGIYEKTYYCDVDTPSPKCGTPVSVYNFENIPSNKVSFPNKTSVPKVPEWNSKNSYGNKVLTSADREHSGTYNKSGIWNKIQRTPNHKSVLSYSTDFSNDLPSSKLPLPSIPKPNLFNLKFEPLNYESDDEHIYEEIEDFPFLPENNRDSIPDSNEAYNHDANAGNNNAHPFLNAGIRPNRFTGSLNNPAINSSNRAPGVINPGDNTSFAIAASRLMGAVDFRGPRPRTIATARSPAINPTTGVNRMHIPEANRFPVNIRPIRPPFGKAPNSNSVGLILNRPPSVDTVVNKLGLSPKSPSRPPFPIGPRSSRPNLFPNGGNFLRPPQDSGGSHFSPNVPVNRTPFGRGIGINSHAFSARGARHPVVPRDDRMNNAVSKVPSMDEENNPINELEIYDPPEFEEYDESEVYDCEEETQTPQEPPELPPPLLPPPVRLPVMSSHPRFANNPIQPNNQSSSVTHPNGNVRAPFKVTIAQPFTAPTTDEVDDHKSQEETRSHPSIPPRTSASSTQPSCPLPRSSNTNNNHRLERKTSGEGIIPPPRMTAVSNRGIETAPDDEGYEQLSNIGVGAPGSSSTRSRIPGGGRGVRLPYHSPAMSSPRHRTPLNIRPPRIQQPFSHPTFSHMLHGGNQPTLLTLENGESFESTPFYESLRSELYFHLISRNEVTKRLTKDGMFLFQPSSSRKESNPLTLWLRYNGQNYKFPINKRQDGKYAIGKEKDYEDKFDSILEMVHHYFQNPLKFEGREMYFRDPAPQQR